MQIRRVVGSYLILGMVAALPAAVKLPGLLSDHMVLQRDEPVHLWGTADAGERVTARFRSAERSTVADPEGRWQIFLPPQSAGGPDELQIAGTNALTLHDVLVGEVWVASGQSNMEWPLRLTNGAKEDIAAGAFPKIRLLKVPFRVSEAPQNDLQTEWLECTPENLPAFSGVAFHFGRAVYQHLNVPVGLIESARGGTPAEAWTGSEELYSTPELQFYLIKWARLFAEYPEASKRYEADLKRWEANGKVVSQRPKAPMGPGSSHVPSGLFNGMIAPLTPYAIRGVIWYQGETNALRAESRLYRTLFPTMIEGWRRRWGLGSFPFLFVQLANYEGVGTGPGTEWPELREAQLYTLQNVPNTGMAVTIDVGTAQNIHPRDKKTVGERLALGARSVAYGEQVVASGPLYRRVTAEPGSLRVWFTSLGGGLRAEGGQALRGFAIAGADRIFEPAEAKVDGETVVVSARAVAEPVAVRYAWADNPVANLENAAGLPASPFRSDDWREAVMRRNIAAAPEGPLPVMGKGGWKAPVDPNLPNVLILGDSISIGYTREVRYLLKGKANVLRPVDPQKDAPMNCRSTVQGLEHLDEWLGNTKWKVIHFNWGLHDLAYRNPLLKTPGQLDRVEGKISVPPPLYEKNLTALVERLQRTGACLVWASTTTVPPGEPGRYEGDERTYNTIAERVMKTHGIAIDDLDHITASFGPDMFIAPGNVHYKPDTDWILGRQVAESIQAAMEKCK